MTIKRTRKLNFIIRKQIHFQFYYYNISPHFQGVQQELQNIIKMLFLYKTELRTMHRKLLIHYD